MDDNGPSSALRRLQLARGAGPQPEHISNSGNSSIGSRTNRSLTMSLVITSACLILSGCAAGHQPLRAGDDEGSEPAERADQMPDSVYKMAPLLFGADIISDYFTEPTDRKSSQPAHNSVSIPAVKGSSSTKGAGHSLRRIAGAEERLNATLSRQRSSKSKTTATVAPSPLSSKTSGEQARGTNAKSGISMDQVVSSLSMVVEAMKQQTMAMQMISGQMAAVKGSEQGQQQETKALLESFGEIIGGLRGARATGGGGVKGATVLEIASEPEFAAKGNEPVTIELPLQQQQQEQLPETSLAPPITTTTTSASTAASTTTTSTAAPSTSTTPKPTTHAAPTTPSASTSAEQASTTLLPLIDKAYKMSPRPTMQSNTGWRNLLPYDFYPYPTFYSLDKPSGSGGVFPASEEPGADKQAVSVSYGSFGRSLLADNYRSVSVPSYGLNGAEKQPSSDEQQQRVLAMVQPHLMGLVHHQQQQQQQQQSQPQLYKQVQQQPQMVHMLAEPPATLMGASPALMHLSPKLAISMMLPETGAEKPTGWLPVATGSQQEDSESASFSKEMPKPPTALKPSGSADKAGLKIGERPMFDPANFQLLTQTDLVQQQSPPKKTSSPPTLQQQPLKLPEVESGDQQEAIEGSTMADLSGNASTHQTDWLKSGSLRPQDEILGEESLGQAPERPVLRSQLLGPPAMMGGKQTGFSVLGGRFKITPNTQVLHYLLEPFHHALGQIMAKGAPHGGEPMPHHMVGPPHLRRGPRRQQRPAKLPGTRKLRAGSQGSKSGAGRSITTLSRQQTKTLAKKAKLAENMVN